MANHVRRQLREAVATAVTGLATTGSRVFQSRVYDVQESELPCLLVYTVSEEVVDASVGNLIGRRVAVVIEGRAKTASDVDDTVDQIAKEVESALAPAVTVGGQGIPVLYEGCEIEMDPAEQPVASINMRFGALLYTQRATPDVIG